MKIFRLIRSIILLASIACILFAIIVIANRDITTTKSFHTRPAEIAKDDDPWDPGDERDPRPKPSSKRVEFQGRSFLVAEKKDDKPWDPGDERRKIGGGKIV